MRKTIRKAFVALALLAAPLTANAQLSNILKNAATAVTGSSETTNTVASVVSNLLGTNKVSESKLVGTWNYSQPCTVVESDNVLSNIGGTVATSKVEKYMTTALTKVGFTAGKVKLVLNKDKSGTITVGSRTTNLTWAVEDANLTFTILTRTITVNAKLDAGDLQLAMSADKLLELVNAVASGASKVNSQFSTISTLLSKYDGLYLGLQFTKE